MVRTGENINSQGRKCEHGRPWSYGASPGQAHAAGRLRCAATADWFGTVVWDREFPRGCTLPPRRTNAKAAGGIALKDEWHVVRVVGLWRH